MSLVKVLFELDENWHGASVETVWAEKIGKDQYRLDNVPFYIKGVSHGDVIIAKKKHDFLQYESVFKRGGHSTYRIIIDHNKMSFDKFKEYWDRHFSRFGCSYESGPEFESNDCRLKIYAIDVHPEANLDKVYSELEKGEAEGLWEFDEGHCYESSKK